MSETEFSWASKRGERLPEATGACTGANVDEIEVTVAFMLYIHDEWGIPDAHVRPTAEDEMEMMGHHRKAQHLDAEFRWIFRR